MIAWIDRLDPRIQGKPTERDAFRAVVIALSAAAIVTFAPALALAGVPMSKWLVFTCAMLAAIGFLLPGFLFVRRGTAPAIVWAGLNATVVVLLTWLYRDYFSIGPLALALLVVTHAVVHGLRASLVAVVVGSIALPIALRGIGASPWGDMVYAAVFLGGSAFVPWTAVQISRRRLLQDHNEIEADLREQAFLDPLTGLSNRLLLIERVEHAIERRRRTAGELAVLFIDLDGFKAVNDRFGHAVGDAILRDIADRLRRVCRPADTAARHGGDEFVVVLEDLPLATLAHQMARRLQAALEPAHDVQGNSIVVHGSIGVAIWSEGDDAAELIAAADRAMYAAKRAEARRRGTRLSVVS